VVSLRRVQELARLLLQNACKPSRITLSISKIPAWRRAHEKYRLIDHSRFSPGLYFTPMRALVYMAPEKVEIQDLPRPQAAAGETEIAVQISGICGSDISGFLGHSALRRPPLVLGHELVGWLPDGRRVVANPLVSCGVCEACLSGAQNLCVSWRLLGLGQTQGSFTEFVTLPSSQVYEIPDALPSARAVLAEPMANVVHLFRIAAPAALFRLAIVGGGTMGALALLVGKLAGARDALLVDVNDDRLGVARKLGAAAAINTGSADGATEARKLAGRGFDVVIDASGSAPARQMAFDLCRTGGLVALLGMGAQKSEVNFVASIRREHRVVMLFAYTPVDFRRALDLLIAGEIELDQWTEQVPLEQGQKAFERMSSSPGPTLKMLLEIASAR
jgi:2-desacetyl-2-hydroxyethyl bacteriochlorophyllide A dehydrogenase